MPPICSCTTAAQGIPRKLQTAPDVSAVTDSRIMLLVVIGAVSGFAFFNRSAKAVQNIAVASVGTTSEATTRSLRRTFAEPVHTQTIANGSMTTGVDDFTRAAATVETTPTASHSVLALRVTLENARIARRANAVARYSTSTARLQNSPKGLNRNTACTVRTCCGSRTRCARCPRRTAVAKKHATATQRPVISALAPNRMSAAAIAWNSGNS